MLHESILAVYYYVFTAITSAFDECSLSRDEEEDTNIFLINEVHGLNP